MSLTFWNQNYNKTWRKNYVQYSKTYIQEKSNSDALFIFNQSNRVTKFNHVEITNKADKQ